jgi:hypothetical protein
MLVLALILPLVDSGVALLQLHTVSTLFNWYGNICSRLYFLAVWHQGLDSRLHTSKAVWWLCRLQTASYWYHLLSQVLEHLLPNQSLTCRHVWLLLEAAQAGGARCGGGGGAGGLACIFWSQFLVTATNLYSYRWRWWYWC